MFRRMTTRLALMCDPMYVSFLCALLSMYSGSINKPGGCAKITKVHLTSDGTNIESLDVKYVLGGGYEKEIDPAIVSPFQMLERGGRKRRGRDFLMEQAEEVVKNVKNAISKATGNKNGTTKNNANSQPPPKTDRWRVGQTREADQATSPSTPVTPEHPSTRKRVPAKKVKLSVPSYVIAAGNVEVSPLPLDRAMADPKETTDARRGLFGDSWSDSAPRKKATLPTQQKPTTVPQDNLPSKSKSRTKKSSVETKRASNVTLEAKAPPTSHVITGDATPTEGQNRASKLSNMKAAAKPSGTQEKLKSVFDYEVRKAREFLDAVRNAPCNEPESSSPDHRDGGVKSSILASKDEVKSPKQ